MYVCVCVDITLVHPAKAVERNEMPFGRNTRVVPSNTVLDSGLVPPREGEILGSPNPSSYSDAVFRLIIFWSLLLLQ